MVVSSGLFPLGMSPKCRLLTVKFLRIRYEILRALRSEHEDHLLYCLLGICLEGESCTRSIKESQLSFNYSFALVV